MGTSNVDNSSVDSKELIKLKQEAEKKYPYPVNPCAFAVAKANYLREIWVNDQLNKK